MTAEVKSSGASWYSTQLTVSADGSEIEDYALEAFTPEALYWLNTMKDIAAVEHQIQDFAIKTIYSTANSSYRTLSLGAYGICTEGSASFAEYGHHS